MNFVDADKNQETGANQAAGGAASAQGAGGGAGASGDAKPAAQQNGAAEGGGRLRKCVCYVLAFALPVGGIALYYLAKQVPASAKDSCRQAAAQGAGQAIGRGSLGAGL